MLTIKLNLCKKSALGLPAVRGILAYEESNTSLVLLVFEPDSIMLTAC